MNDHGDHTFVTLVEEPAYQARCNLCGWKGPLRSREQYSLSVEDGQRHASQLKELIHVDDHGYCGVVFKRDEDAYSWNCIAGHFNEEVLFRTEAEAKASLIVHVVTNGCDVRD